MAQVPEPVTQVSGWEQLQKEVESALERSYILMHQSGTGGQGSMRRAHRGATPTMSRMPFLRCAQCEIRHQSAFETKRQKTVGTVMTDSSTQTRRAEQTHSLRKRGVQLTQNDVEHKQDKVVKSFLHFGGWKRESWMADRMPEWIKTVPMDPRSTREVRWARQE